MLLKYLLYPILIGLTYSIKAQDHRIHCTPNLRRESPFPVYCKRIFRQILDGRDVDRVLTWGETRGRAPLTAAFHRFQSYQNGTCRLTMAPLRKGEWDAFTVREALNIGQQIYDDCFALFTNYTGEWSTIGEKRVIDMQLYLDAQARPWAGQSDLDVTNE